MIIEEAMGRAITLVTPMKQNTTGNGIPSFSFSPSRSDMKVESRYLRPTMASCHDSCKYVKKLDYEAASRNFRTFRKKNIVREREKERANGEERRTRARTKPRMGIESKPESDFSDEPSFSKPKTPALTKKSITPAETKTLVTETKQKAPPSDEKPQAIKRKAPLPLERVDASACRSAVLLKAKTPSTTRSISSHLKSQEEKEATKSLGFLKLGGVASKHPLNSLKTKAPPLLRSISARRNQERIGEGAVGPANTLKTESLRDVKNSTSVKTRHKAGGTNAKKSDSVTDELSRKEISKVGNERGARRSSAARSEDTNSMPYKLKFRQGKVMELRGGGDSSSGATRLRFGFGKMSGDNPSDNNNLAWRRSFRKKKKDNGDPDSNLRSSEAHAVVLKHQEAEMKKDAQALLNRMIEETASRLVGVRKSKVKALVGAFETVMSRQ